MGNEMSGSYVSGNSGMNHYSSGSAQRNMHPSTGTGSQRSLNMRSSSLSSGSQSVPEIGYLEEEFSEVENSNTVFIQNHGSAGNNGMQNHGSSGMQNHGSSGMQNLGSSGSYGTQNHGSSGSGVHNQGSSSSGISDMNYQSVGYY